MGTSRMVAGVAGGDAGSGVAGGRWMMAALLAGSAAVASAQGFPNEPQTVGELLAGPIAPQQGRTAIIAWHGDHIVTVPEIPGSQPGADVYMRVVNIADPRDPVVTVLPARASGFHAHAYFQSANFLYVGPHCMTATLNPCTGSGNVWADSLRIGGPGQTIGTSQLTRASMETHRGVPIGGIDKSGTQSPWGVRDFWSYNDVSGNTFLAVRRSLSQWIYDWNNGGAPTGPAIRSTWDHLGLTGVVGFPFIMGNILIFASDQTGSGVASYDISDPANPVLLDVLKEENPGGYWPEVYGHYVFFPRRDGEGGPSSSAGFMVVDFSDPTELRVVANRNLPGLNQYVNFQDEFAFMNKYKIDMRTFDVALELQTVPGVIDTSQFALPIGNLLATGGYGSDGPGLAIWAHQAARDDRAPYVLYHVPRPDQTNYSIHCPITLSIPETLRTQTIVEGTSLIVRPVGGAAIPIFHSFSQGKLLTVTPRQTLQPNTTYEVVLTSAIQDAAGNGLEPYTFRFSTGGDLVGGNQPPAVAIIEASPAVAQPGNAVALSWEGTDPDGGALEYRVDVGDGTPRSAWGPGTLVNHVYESEGHYQVTVQVRDPQGSVAAKSRTMTVVVPPAQPNSTASSLLALHDGHVFTANPDTDTVSAIDAESLERLWEVPVGRAPRGIARGSDGSLWVVSRDSDRIDILDEDTGAGLDTIALAYGRSPVAIAATPDGATMLVTCEGDRTLRRYSVATRAQTGQVTLGPSPRAIAIKQSGTRALVTRFLSGEHVGQVYDVNLAGGMTLTRTIELTRDRAVDGGASSRGVPNYLAGIRISPDGQWAWVVGKKDNTTRGTFFGPTMVPGQDTTVRAQLMLIDLTANVEDVTRRLDIDNSDSPSAIAFSPLGDYAFLALQGNAMVAVIDVLDFMRQDSPGTVRSRWSVGLAPQAIAMDAANNRVLTGDFMGRTLTALDVEEFLTSGNTNVSSVAAALVGEEKLHDDVLQGKRLFYHASDPRMSAEGYISCATCHIDGGHDGRTFDFTNRGEGFRNTTDLRGRSGTAHGNVHWSGNFDEIQDFEIDIRQFFGGAGFLADNDWASVAPPLGAPKANRSADLDALAAYVSSLGASSIPRSPHRNGDGSMSEAALRGQAVFMAHNCASCHNPATDYTDGLMHNVGTLKASSGNRLGGALTAIRTPTLLGVHAGAPYLHDGSAATLEEVFTVTGGRLAQMEHGTMGSGAFAEDINWIPMKEWHNSQFVNIQGSRTVTFSDVASSSAGPGYIEVRYNSAYGNSVLNVRVNGVLTAATMTMVPNEPSWWPNEWRRVRVPVQFSAGMNTVQFSRGGSAGPQLLVDDVLFSTPQDALLAAAHVRTFAPGQRDDLVAYLRSLDGTDAQAPLAIVAREGIIAQDAVDVVTVPDGAAEFNVLYTIQNAGGGILNLGRFHLASQPDGAATLVRHPAAQVAPGGSTEMEVRFVVTGETTSTAMRGWSDGGELRWTAQTSTGVVPVTATWSIY